MTSKRQLSISSLGGLSDPAVSTLPNPSHQLKKIRVDADESSEQDTLAMNITDPVHAELRSAINIKKALDSIYRLSQLGYCPTKVQQFRNNFDLNDSHFRVPGSRTTPEMKFRKRDRANQVILNELGTVYKDMKSLSVSHAFAHYSPQIDDLLPVWFEHSAISGYGDMQSLETKVDSEVRNAREIPASEFEVEPEFTEQIQKSWGEHFLPRKVRAEPYKIHLYGPGGHFKSHRDTPETGLVGTFLVGLGDTSGTSNSNTSDTPNAPAGHFRIGDKTLRAERCSWVAFHPDIPHEVTKLEDGYRAVLAFKIFRVADDDEPDVLPTQLEPRVKRILDQIPAPFGLLTTHQYSIGTTSLNGFDALLSAYAHSRNDTQAYMLPVVTKFNGEAYDNGFDPREYENVATSRVYPFTAAHVDILLKRNAVQARKEVQWLDEWADIPFYAWNIRASLEVWKEDHPDGSGYTGNEADSQREDSVYLSYAILFLPKKLSLDYNPGGHV